MKKYCKNLASTLMYNAAIVKRQIIENNAVTPTNSTGTGDSMLENLALSKPPIV
jgi:hypothetical protein